MSILILGFSAGIEPMLLTNKGTFSSWPLINGPRSAMSTVKSASNIIGKKIVVKLFSGSSGFVSKIYNCTPGGLLSKALELCEKVPLISDITLSETSA